MLLILAAFGFSNGFVVAYLVLAFTDLIDGPLARKWNQRTEVGAGLDSAADIALSSSLVVGAVILRWYSIQNELVWIGGAIASYLVAIAVGYFKFGRVPSYHTWSAKLNHLLVVVAGLCVILDWSAIPLRVACATTVIANIENLLITCLTKECQSDVHSVFLLKRNESDAT